MASAPDPTLVQRPVYERLPAPSNLSLTKAPLPDPPPAVFVRAVLWMRGTLSRIARAIGPAELRLFDDLSAGLLLPTLSALIKHGIPEALADGPKTAAELAKQCSLAEDALFRALRGTSLRGYFRLRPDGRFEHTLASKALMGGQLSRTRELLLYFGSGSNLAAWSRFAHALETGGSPFDYVHGMNVWEWFEQHPDEGEIFAHGMMGLTAVDATVIARIYPFARISTVCDVGGGCGTLLSELLIRYPHMKGVLCDSAQVLESARRVVEARGVQARVELAPGDFFQAVPVGADAYLLKNVLHDWDDARCITILQNVRTAAGATGRILIAERFVDRFSKDPLGVPADLQMMVACSRGRERCLEEFERLLEQSGLRVSRLYTYPTISVLEARCK